LGLSVAGPMLAQSWIKIAEKLEQC